MSETTSLRDALEAAQMSVHEFETYHIAGNAPRVTPLGGEAVVDEVDFVLWVLAIKTEAKSR